MSVTWAEIREEFEYSLGYINGDIQALCRGPLHLQYTVALFVGVACEALEDAGAYADKTSVLEEMLPDADWKKLKRPLFDAIRHGLAHNFDTKHIYVDGNVIQIHFFWDQPEMIRIQQANGKDRLYIGTCSLGDAVCRKILDFKIKLQNDPDARQRFSNSLNRSGRRVDCDPQLWSVLRAKP